MNTVSVRAVAHNATTRPVLAQLSCAREGLVVRVLEPNGAVGARAPVVCRPQHQRGADTIPAGDSLVSVARFGLVGPSGTYRVQAVYEAMNGQSPVAELPFVVR
jgi:hypothetical protein